MFPFTWEAWSSYNPFTVEELLSFEAIREALEGYRWLFDVFLQHLYPKRPSLKWLRVESQCSQTTTSLIQKDFVCFIFSPNLRTQFYNNNFVGNVCRLSDENRSVFAAKTTPMPLFSGQKSLPQKLRYFLVFLALLEWAEIAEWNSSLVRGAQRDVNGWYLANGLINYNGIYIYIHIYLHVYIYIYV